MSLIQRPQQMTKIEIKLTEDGSNTLYLSEIDEHYHSTYGAVQESQHVFIGAGFNSFTANELSILEIGFGTGLNCFLTMLASLKSNQKICYTAIEKFPLSEDIWGQMNYNKLLKATDPELFSLLHRAPWNTDTAINSHFSLHKIEADLLNICQVELPLADLVYFDAFSPDKQPELWDLSVFKMLYAQMKEESMLVTYCAKGAVRRILQAVGFQVERIPGPPGKREMIRARKRLKIKD
jgi:tRNA U34 5-methylaminomethyl-2-thiouridine-forming methyltransferase MnmC